MTTKQIEWVVILAGNHVQAFDWAARNLSRNFKALYVQRAFQLRGLERGTKYVKVGTWYENLWASDLMDEIEMREMEPFE